MRDAFIPAPGQPPSWRDRLILKFRRHGWRGFIRLYTWLKPITARRQLRTVTRYGTQFFLTPWDSVDHHVITEGFYESEVLEALRPALSEPGAVLWVVGANFGLHAVTAKFRHPTATVVAFEPSPAMGARLIEHCELNRVTVELHAYALSDANGALPFFANAGGNPGMSTLHPVNAFEYHHKFVVATLSAADVIARGLAPAPTALLVDAEGAETEVLRGFGSHLAASTLRTVVFEADNNFLQTGATEELHALVTRAGFSLRQLVRNEDTAHTLSNFVGSRT
ncbi:MAG: FkbM family methyltransferase [Lacunisphaera sp.]